VGTEAKRLVKGVDLKLQLDLSVLPGLNALLNSISAIFIISGIVAVKRKRRDTHKRFMFAAAVTSAVFLVSYVIKTIFYGTTPFGGEGLIRAVYLTVLFTHLTLAIGVVPMVIASVLFGWKGRLERHRRIARWTYPIWLYVSVTGVAVFFMLRPYY